MPAAVTGNPVLRAGRLRWLGLAIVCGTFAAGGLYLIFKGEGRGYAVAGFFGLAALLALAMLRYGHANLRLADDGFVLGLVWRDRTYRWKDISSFGVVSIRGNLRVAFDVPRDRSALARLARRQLGFSAILPDSYGMKADELADLMNQWRAAALEPGDRQ